MHFFHKPRVTVLKRENSPLGNPFASIIIEPSTDMKDMTHRRTVAITTHTDFNIFYLKYGGSCCWFRDYATVCKGSLFSICSCTPLAPVKDQPFVNLYLKDLNEHSADEFSKASKKTKGAKAAISNMINLLESGLIACPIQWSAIYGALSNGGDRFDKKEMAKNLQIKFE